MTQKNKKNIKWVYFALILLLLVISFSFSDVEPLQPQQAVKKAHIKQPETVVKYRTYVEQKASKPQELLTPTLEYAVENTYPNQHIFDDKLCTSDNLRANYEPALNKAIDGLTAKYNRYAYPLNDYVNLNVYATHLSKRLERKLTQSIAFIHKNYIHMLGSIAKRKIEINLVIAPTRDEYNAFYFTYSTKLKNNTLGVYFGGLNIVFVDYQRSDDKALKTAIHESVHAFNAHIIGKTPRMFNEGMAELYEDLDIDSDKRELLISPERLIKEPLPIMLFFDHAQWPYLDASDLYYSSWAWITFMRSDNTKTRSLINLMKQEQLTPCVAFTGDEVFTLLLDDNSMFEIEFYQWQEEIMIEMQNLTTN